MKKLSIRILALICVSILISACSIEDSPIFDELTGNEYQIKVDGELYEEGQSPFAGIYLDPRYENTMTAELTITLSISFDCDHYNSGEVLAINTGEDDETLCIGTGLLTFNKSGENEESILYITTSGTVTVVSKKRVEFNLICVDISNVDETGSYENAETFVLSGFITESDPE